MIFPLLPPEPCTDRPIADTQGFGDTLQALALCSHLQNPVPVNSPHWAAKLLTVRPCIPNPSAYPLPYQVTLKLRHRRHDGKERLPERTACIDVLLIADELDAEGPKFLQGQKQVLGGAGKPIMGS